MRLVLLLSLVVARPLSAQDLVLGNIYNGTRTGEFPAVVGVGILNGDGTAGLCSGTLIAPTAVLTAGHCLAFGPVDGIAAVFADGSTRRDYRAAAFIPHPIHARVRPWAISASCSLTTPVTDVVPLPVATRAAPAHVGAIVGLVRRAWGRDGSRSARSGCDDARVSFVYKAGGCTSRSCSAGARTFRRRTRAPGTREVR
jgi:hypothetical protein